MLQLLSPKSESKTSTNSESLYFYIINYPAYEKSLCTMELKYLFNITPEKNYFLTSDYIKPSRSVFIKQCISIIYTASTLEDIINQIINNKVSYDNFKVSYINIEEDIEFSERRKIEYKVGFNILGDADVHNPKVLLGITKINGKWLFGELTENKSIWTRHNKKPYSYCNAITVRTARALVNLAVGNNTNFRIIDPCCGIGTVVIEALSMGINITGYEINPLIASNAKKNIKYFGYNDTIKNGDMHCITEKYDAAIIDLPYGLFTPVTLEQQLAIIKTTRRIADKAVIVSLINMEEHFINCGFKIVDRCHVSKGTFKRYITICE
jgi:tRNA G10  N-methylase Trm11